MNDAMAILIHVCIWFVIYRIGFNSGYIKSVDKFMDELEKIKKEVL